MLSTDDASIMFLVARSADIAICERADQAVHDLSATTDGYDPYEPAPAASVVYPHQAKAHTTHAQTEDGDSRDPLTSSPRLCSAFPGLIGCWWVVAASVSDDVCCFIPCGRGADWEA